MDFGEFVENARTRKAAAFNDAITGDMLNRLKRSSPDPGEYRRRPGVRELIDQFSGRGLKLCKGHPCDIRKRGFWDAGRSVVASTAIDSVMNVEICE